MTRIWLLAVLLLVPLSPNSWAESPADKAPMVLNVVPPRGDCLRYLVRPFPSFKQRVRTDYLRVTVVWRGDTLLKEGLWSEMEVAMMAADVPDSAHPTFSYAIERYEQTFEGRKTLGPVWHRWIRPAYIDAMFERDRKARMRGGFGHLAEPLAAQP